MPGCPCSHGGPRWRKGGHASTTLTLTLTLTLTKFVAETLPKLPKRPGKFRDMLAADAAAQRVLASYEDKLQAWQQRLVVAGKDGAALYARWESQLEAAGCLEKRSIVLDAAGNLHSSLTPLQARVRVRVGGGGGGWVRQVWRASSSKR